MLTVLVSVLYHCHIINTELAASCFTVIKCKILKPKKRRYHGVVWKAKQRFAPQVGLWTFTWLVLFNGMGVKAEWPPHRPTLRHIQFQPEPAPISTASQHLNSRLSQLLDHCAPPEWSWFLINGIHTFVKWGSKRNGSTRRSETTLMKPFHRVHKAAFVWRKQTENYPQPPCFLIEKEEFILDI